MQVAPARNEGTSRSATMVACLKEGYLYAEKRARDFFFDGMEAAIDCRAPAILSQITREARGKAQAAAETAGFRFTQWDVAARAVTNAMLNAGVLLGCDGTPVPAGIRAQATRVAAIEADFRDSTEAYLIEFLIRRLGDVGWRDHTALAHALFRQFDRRIAMADMEDRVVILLASLADRVVLLDNGIYRASEQ